MNLNKLSGLFILMILTLSLRSFAQNEFYQVGFELYKGTSSDFSDIVYCNLVSGGNAGIDNSDLPKLDQFAENVSVYRNQRDFGIETRPLVNCTDTIQLRLYKTPTTTTNFRLVVDLNTYPETTGLTAVIQDKFLNTERALKFGDTTIINFTITSNANTTGLRYRVVFRRTQVVTSPFVQLPPVCKGDAINLPTISSNGVKGTWTPAVNNTATTIYTFIPSEGQCATTQTMTVQVTEPTTTPSFAQVAAVCKGTAFILPTTSNNGITGSWLPAINTNTTTTYTFTPSAGQCASTASMTVQVNEPVTPVFNQIGPFNSGESFTLPSVSNDGISGNWSPAINNTTTTTYTFTPLAGECATVTQLTVVINTATSLYDVTFDRGVSIYPNPVSKNGTIQLLFKNQKAGKYELQFFAIDGTLVQKSMIIHTGGSSSRSININQNIGSGHYLVRIVNEMGEMATMKLMVK